MKRTASALLATTVAAAAVVLATGQPAVAATGAVNLPLTSWAYLDSQSPTSKFVNPAVPPPVGTIADAAGKAHTYRSYFTYDLTQLKGQVVHGSYLYTYEDTVTDCSSPATVEIWRTTPVKDRTTWRNPPTELERLAQVKLGPDAWYCPSYVGHNMVDVLNAALARKEKSITFEYRVTQAQETDARAGRTIEMPTLSSTSNHPPTVDGLALAGSDRPCGTLAKPSPGRSSVQLRAVGHDADEGDYVRITFALWPVEHPDQRQEREWSGEFDLSAHAQGTVFAWQARGADYYDAGPWSKTCYIVLDKEAPTKAPVVTSRVFREPYVQAGGVGVPAKIRIDAAGDRDVVAFAWRDWRGHYGQVAARRPGGSAILEYAPARFGPQSLHVTPIDAAGNRGPETEFEFWVADTAPFASVDVAGVGLPSTIRLEASTAGTTAFGFQLPGAAEVRVPAVGGKATGTVTFTATGTVDLVVRNYAGSKVIGQDTVQVNVTDSPIIESAEFATYEDVVVGTTGTLTFRPRNVDVVAYEYYTGSGWQRVEARADDTASVQYTATEPGWRIIAVRSIKADGTASQNADLQFNVVDSRPNASAPDLDSSIRFDAPGLPLRIDLYSFLPDVTGFAYRLNGGPETVVEGSGWGTQITVTPQLGDNTLVFQAILAGGTRSPEGTFTFQPHDGPVITFDPEGGPLVGLPVTIKLRSVVPGTKEIRYRLDYADEQTVPVGADGTATVQATFDGWGAYPLEVRSVTHDGVESQTRHTYLSPRETRPYVYSSWYNEHSAYGGIGVPAQFTFNTQWMPETVEFRYSLNGGPEQTVQAATDGTPTAVTITPDRNGLSTLAVRGRTADGQLSPPTEYRFQVGTAPHVISAEYPPGIVAGGVGQEGHFTFSGGTPGITSFEYSFNGLNPQTVPATPTGAATIAWTPASAGWFTLYVRGLKADGTQTDQSFYNFVVADS